MYKGLPRLWNCLVLRRLSLPHHWSPARFLDLRMNFLLSVLQHPEIPAVTEHPLNPDERIDPRCVSSHLRVLFFETHLLPDHQKPKLQLIRY